MKIGLFQLPNCTRLSVLSMVLATQFISSCAILHSVDVGEMNFHKSPGVKVTPLDVKVSEMGISVGEAATVADILLKNEHDSRVVRNLRAIIGLFQLGPRTGNPVFSEKYADKIIDEILEQCPSGQLTNVVTMRETNKYPVISGEIVRITGDCMQAPSKRSKTSGKRS